MTVLLMCHTSQVGWQLIFTITKLIKRLPVKVQKSRMILLWRMLVLSETKRKISALLEAVLYRNNRLTESDSDNSEAAGSPSTVNISPLRVQANDDSPVSDASNILCSLDQ